MDYEIFLEDEESGLLVSNLGRVVGPTGQILKQSKNRTGYHLVTGARSHRVQVHRLVARNFIPNPNNLPIINHKDENPSNNRVDNLEWCTYRYNASYGTARERRQLTANRNGSHCAEIPVLLIKGEEVKSFKSQAEAGRFIGVSASAISGLRKGRLRSRRGWHLPDVKVKERPASYTFCNGEETKTFKTLAEADAYIGVGNGAMSSVASGKRNSLHGWHLPGGRVKKEFKKPITITDGSDLRSFDSYREAASYLMVSSNLICLLANGKRSHVKGWHLPGHDPNVYTGRKVRLTKSGVSMEFSSFKEAAKHFCIDDSFFGKKLRRTGAFRGWKMELPNQKETL